MLTGESRRSRRRQATRRRRQRRGGGSLRVEVEAVGRDTALSGIMRLVAEAQASTSPAQALADRAAAVLFYVALAAGTITLRLVGARRRAGGRDSSEPRPCSSSRARTRSDWRSRSSSRSRPRSAHATACSSGTGWRWSGPSPRRRRVRQDRHVDARPAGAPAVAADDERGGAALAASVEADSEHPLARAIVERPRREGCEPARRATSRRCPGAGCEPWSTAHRSRSAGPGCSRTSGSSADAPTGWTEQGDRPSCGRRRPRRGRLALEDEVRPESAEAVEALSTTSMCRSR